MKPLDRRKLQLTLVAGAAVIFFLSISVNPSAQTKAQIPTPTSHVSDLVNVLDDQTKQRLETMLENLKQRKEIDFCLAIVETTAAQDIFDFSRQLASDWNLGSRTTAKKSLLLVVAVNERAAFTQFSRSVQSDLPDGVLGEMSQRMRGPLAAGQFSDAVNTGVNHFVGAVATKAGLSLKDFEQSAEIAASKTSETTPQPSPDVSTVAPATPDAVLLESVKSATRTRRTTPPAKAPTPAPGPAPVTVTKANSSEDDAAEAEEVELTLTLPFEPRVAKLKEFLETHPRSKVRAHAQELLISAYAALGDQKLRSGDTAGGVEALFLAIDQAPTTISDKLYTGVISQIPLNLYLSNERAYALKAAQTIEAKFGSDPKRLLTIAAFYLRVENGDEAVRVASQVVKLAPDMAEAHHALALGLHISLRLDEAMVEYKKALELDPKSKGTRRSLADLNRAAGKSQEAITLYREQLTVEPTDKAARTGLVIALLDAGLKEEANTELEAALRDDPKNIGLLTGAAYWFAAHGENDRSLDLARRAVEIEPRYTWAQIAAARALVGIKQPMDAERALRYARQYGKFPTLDYELASVLAAAGLYEEAAELLQPIFVLKDGMIETRLGGRLLARDPGFLELLAPERRASIFQFTAADNPENAAMLKDLLAFSRTLSEEPANETAVVAAAKQFASGQDNMRAYRQLYASSRLIKKNLALGTAYELAQAAKTGVDAAMEVPAVTIAVQADELREIRARAIASGGTPNIAEAPRAVLSKILLGRIEDFSGWVLFNQDKAVEAVEYLKRAVSTLPEGTPSWRAALWHLGAAQEQTGQKDEALNSYIKSYVSGDPDPIRRQLIEQLYRKVNGSLDGLDQRLTAPASGSVAAAAPETSAPVNNQTTAVTDTTGAASSPSRKPLPSPSTSAPTPSPESVSASTTEKKAEQPLTRPESVRPTTAEPTPSPEATPAATPESTPAATPQPTPTEEEALARAAARIRSNVKITGRVKDANNNGVANVVVVLISPRGTVLASTTDSEGKYSFSVSPSQRNYRLLPSKEGMLFDPVDRSVVAYIEDLKEIDFVATSRAP